MDPGTSRSAYIILDLSNTEIIEHRKTDNIEVIDRLKRADYENFAIERIKSYGFKAGQSLFDTCEWSGRFIQVATDKGVPVDRIGRKTIVAWLLGDAKAGDKQVRLKMAQIYGAIPSGSSKWLANDDRWQALGLAHAYSEGLRE